MNLSFLFITLFMAPLITATPWISEGKLDDEFWVYCHVFKDYSTNYGPTIQIFFMGHSINYNWRLFAAQLFQERYESRGGVNYGMGGDKTENMLWRIQNGEMDNCPNFKMIVLMAGTNNFNSDTPADIATGVYALVQEILARAPRAKILLLGVLPFYNFYFDYVCDLNIRLSKFHNGHNVTYVDMMRQFAQSWNQLKVEYYTNDLVHINELGYAQLDQIMGPTFDEMFASFD